MRIRLRSLAALALAASLICPSLFSQYKPALPGYRYEFPRDFFSHPDFQTEWWYYTGNLQSADGQQFGFELTFFRSAVTRNSSKPGPWDVRDLYFAHFAVSDLGRKKFFHTERTNRSGPGIAGADSSAGKVWNGNWSVVWKNGQEILTAVSGPYSIELSLQSQKPPVIHGLDGVSQKSAGAGRASHYFSETRLRATGTLQTAEKSRHVAGQAWMDHEFFTEQLAPEQAGWDWLSLQLDDGSELMLFHIRRKDGSIDPFSAGTLVDPQGRSRHLNREDFTLEPSGETWVSPVTAARYPIHWKIRVPSAGVILDASTPLASQELTTGNKLAPSYWEGAIQLRGEKSGAPLHGSGYLEMTGYDRQIAMN